MICVKFLENRRKGDTPAGKRDSRDPGLSAAREAAWRSPADRIHFSHTFFVFLSKEIHKTWLD